VGRQNCCQGKNNNEIGISRVYGYCHIRCRSTDSLLQMHSEFSVPGRACTSLVITAVESQRYQMSDAEGDLEDGLVIPQRSDPVQNPIATALQVSRQSRSTHLIEDEEYDGPQYDLAWVNSLHQQILDDVRTRGIEACRWSNVLEKWKESLSNAPFEEVELGCIRLIMQHARLTPVAQPTFYETLRKLGRDILSEEIENDDVRRDLLHRLLTPTPGDSAMYTQYFGARERWEDRRSLSNHLDKLHAQYGSSLSQELTKEKVLGFMVPHIRSNRYHPVELGAILRHFVRDIDGAQRWNDLADSLQNDAQASSEQSSEAQAFILRCFENIYRARQSLKGAEKRNRAVGVILFADLAADAEHGEMRRTRLDVWYDEEMELSSRNPSDRAYQNPLERCSLKKVQALLASEEREWNTWAPRLQNRGDFRIGDQPLFQLLGPSRLAANSLLSQVMNSIKAYCEKKKSLRDLARKSSKRCCVQQAIEDWGADLQQAAAAVPRGGHRIAVFGYTLNSDGRGVPEAEEQSGIVRSVRLTRKCGGDESGGSEELDTCVFEV
jgi:hypothetical protein